MAMTTYPDGTDVIQVIHAKHLLVWVLDGIENWGWGLVELATIQPFSSAVREAETSEVPETGRLFVFVIRLCLEPARTLGIGNVCMVWAVE